MLDKVKNRILSSNGAHDAKRSNIVVNLVNIADVIDASNMDLATSCMVIIGIEPFVLENLTAEGLRRDINISKDHEGNIRINNIQTEFLEIGNGIKVLIALSEEKEPHEPVQPQEESPKPFKKRGAKSSHY